MPCKVLPTRILRTSDGILLCKLAWIFKPIQMRFYYRLGKEIGNFAAADKVSIRDFFASCIEVLPHEVDEIMALVRKLTAESVRPSPMSDTWLRPRAAPGSSSGHLSKRFLHRPSTSEKKQALADGTASRWKSGFSGPTKGRRFTPRISYGASDTRFRTLQKSGEELRMT